MRIALIEVKPGIYELPDALRQYGLVMLHRVNHLARPGAGYYEPPMCGAAVPVKDNGDVDRGAVKKRRQWMENEVHVCGECYSIVQAELTELDKA